MSTSNPVSTNYKDRKASPQLVFAYKSIITPPLFIMRDFSQLCAGSSDRVGLDRANFESGINISIETSGYDFVYFTRGFRVVSVNK